MEILPPLALGYVRIELRFRLPGAPPTPGDLALAAGVHPNDLGPIMVAGVNAVIDVRSEQVQRARDGLAALGMTRVADWNFRWLKMNVGRNHGLTIGQLRKVLVAADALPLGKFNINNTHTLIGVQDQKAEGVLKRLADTRINGQAVRPELLPASKTLGSASFSASGG
jgi:hypothetical protein